MFFNQTILLADRFKIIFIFKILAISILKKNQLMNKNISIINFQKRSKEWKLVTAKERKSLGFVDKVDGEFW